MRGGIGYLFNQQPKALNIIQSYSASTWDLLDWLHPILQVVYVFVEKEEEEEIVYILLL